MQIKTIRFKAGIFILKLSETIYMTLIFYEFSQYVFVFSCIAWLFSYFRVIDSDGC